MDSRKSLDMENLIVIMKGQGMDTRKVEDFVEEIRAERQAGNEKALTTANSEGPKN